MWFREIHVRTVTKLDKVFITWDDEYDKLQCLMRDSGKKKRDEHLT